MFAKRKQKSEKWVVAENQPKPSAALAEPQAPPAAPAPGAPVDKAQATAMQNQLMSQVQVGAFDNNYQYRVHYQLI